MRRRTRLSIRRKMSGTLACLLTAISVLSTSSTVPAMAADSKVKMSYKQEKVEKIGIHVEAENESFSAGSDVMLNVYIQNNSGEPLTDGTLKWFDKKETLAQGGFVYDSEYNVVNAEEATPDSADEGAADLTAAEETAEAESVPAEAMQIENAAPAESTAAETEAASVESVTAEAEAAPVENAPAETKAGPAGPAEETNAAAKEGPAGPAEEITASEAAGPASDMVETAAPAGPASDNGEFGSSWEDDWSDEYDADEDIEGPYLDSEGNLCNIDLAPGEIFEVQFSGTIDSDIYGLKNRDLRFAFGARKENGRRLSNNYKFQFNTGLMTMLPVEFVDGNQVEANEEHSMILRLGLDDIEYMFEEIEHSKPTVAVPSVGTPSEAVPATPSEAEKEAENEFTPAEVIKPEIETQATLATPSEAELEEDAAADETELAEEEMEEDIEETTAAIEATPSEATPSEAVKTEDKSDEDDDFDDDEDSEGVFNPEDVKYSIETYGVRLKGVKARFDVDASGPAESVTEVSYRVASGTEPGLYFGKVTASVKFNGNTYKTSQGFAINVTGEGKMALRGKLGDAEIIVSGEPSSFGAEDYEILSLQVTEVPVEKEEMITEAMEKKSEETGVAVEKMKAMDIKVVGDGEVRELQGPVTVTFAGLELEEVRQAEAEPEEEKSLVEKATALMSLDGEAEEATAEETASEQNTAVWHLDEDAVELNEMDSYVNDDGDVVMETDHFSIFVVVNLPTAGGIINVTVEHWGTIETLDGYATASTNTDTAFDITNSNVKTKTITQQIYTSDVIALQQSSYQNIEELSKVSLSAAAKTVKNYNVDRIWVTTDKANIGKQTWSNYTEYSNTSAKKEITLTGDSVIRIFYKENTTPGYYNNSTTFYDHNVTDGRIYSSVDAGQSGWSYFMGYESDGSYKTSGSSVYKYLYSLGQGTNYGLDGKTTPVLGAGQPVSGNKSSWAYNKYNGKYLNAGNGTKGNQIVTGLVKNTLGTNGVLQFSDSIVAAPFFAESSRELGGASYYGTKKIDGYQLKFRQQGDTYILSNVTKNGVNQTGNLETIKAYEKASSNGVYSNDFWPLDNCEDYYGKDAPMGVWTESDRLYWMFDNNGNRESTRLSASDFDTDNTDGAHNFHFGMRYDFTFKIGDYTGPMNYYFRGDDDFYLFIDDRLAVDIGGIHIASGQSIDIRKWLSGDAEETARLGTSPTDAIKNNYANNKDHVYKCTVYFMERGGYGSCCYMRCTLPNYTEVPTVDIETTSVTVTKRWDDFDNPNRPKNVTVRLLRNNVEVDRHILAGTGDTWSYTWTELPKKDGSGKSYTYKVEEVTPAGYQATYDGNTITNSLSPAVKVKVTKVWDDGGNICGNRPSSITFRLVEDGTPTIKTITLGRRDVSGTNTWSGTFENLPKYKYTYDSSGNYTGFKEIVYTVQEMNGSSPVTKNGTISGVNGSDALYKYTLTGIEDVLTDDEKTANIVTHTEFINKHTHAFEATKTWSDGNEKHSGDTIKVGLYEKSGIYWVPVAGKVKEMTYSGGTISVTFDNLDPGKEYRVKELVAGTASDFEFNMSGTYYKGLNEGGVYADYYTVSYTNPINTTTCKPGMAITNELRQIKVRVAKWIDNYNVKLDNNDLREDEFIVNVKQINGSFETGLVLKHAGKPGISGDELDAAKYSGYIELLAGSDGKVVLKLSEVMPKEYEASIPFLTVVGDPNSLVSVTGDTVTLKPGADAVILVHNTFEHSDYFHNEAAAMNKFDPAEKVTVNLAAVVPEKKDWAKEFSGENVTMM